MAAPHVSGVIAAFLSARPEFIGRPQQVKSLLTESATDLGPGTLRPGRRPGRPDADARERLTKGATAMEPLPTGEPVWDLEFNENGS